MARILVIEDDGAFRFALGRVLRMNGYEVDEAATGREGLQCIAATPPDVVLVDIFMPEPDGIEFILLVRKHSSPVPIIAMSGAGAPLVPNVLTAARDFGAQYTLTKPFSPEVLLTTVANLVAG